MKWGKPKQTFPTFSEFLENVKNTWNFYNRQKPRQIRGQFGSQKIKSKIQVWKNIVKNTWQFHILYILKASDCPLHFPWSRFVGTFRKSHNNGLFADSWLVRRIPSQSQNFVYVLAKIGSEVMWRHHATSLKLPDREFVMSSIFRNLKFLKNWGSQTTLGQKPTFYPEITNNLMFEIVNFVNNESLKLWISWKIRFWKCEFCEKWCFQNVNFWINCGFLPQCGMYTELFTHCGKTLIFSPKIQYYFKNFWFQTMRFCRCVV